MKRYTGEEAWRQEWIDTIDAAIKQWNGKSAVVSLTNKGNRQHLAAVIEQALTEQMQ